MVKPKSFHLQWHVTDKCNFVCKHCYTEKPTNELNTDEMYVVLDQYVDMIKRWKMDVNKRPRLLSISGGEPLLRRDIFKLLGVINENRDMFTNVVLMSNGSTITYSVVKKIKDFRVSFLQISLDGLERNNDKIRGKGNFKRAVNGIKKSIENNISVGLSVTLNKINLKDIPGIIDLGKELGVKVIGINRLVTCGRGKSLDMLDPLELKEVYKYLMGMRTKLIKNRIHLNTHCSDSLWFIEDSKHETHGCSAGYDSFSILPNGDVVPCRRLPIKVGNVLENTLFDIWYNSEILWDLRNREIINQTCKKCEVFGKCLGGAKCVANSYFGSPFAPDPQCWKSFKKLPSPSRFSASENAKNFILNRRYVEDF